MRRWAAILGAALLLVAAVNFTAFFVAALALGGDAINGKAEGGRYYLSHHGKYTEVVSGRLGLQPGPRHQRVRHAPAGNLRWGRVGRVRRAKDNQA